MEKNIKVNLENEKNLKEFIHMNRDSQCQIDIRSGQKYVDGKSLLGLFTLNLLQPVHVSLIGDENKVQDLVQSYNAHHLIVA